MSALAFSQALIDFIEQSPTPFHATQTMKQRLLAAGFIELKEADSWQMQAGGRYLVTRNDSSLIAFVYGEQSLPEQGIRMIGAHTDSPCLKVKPNADIYSQGYWQLGVEVYGGMLLNPWFDRELGLAGRVSYENQAGELCYRLINIDQAIGMVPNLAIHLDREANKNKSINPQKELPVVMGLEKPGQNLKALLSEHLADESLTSILDYELYFYDMQPGRIFGVDKKFIAAARLDNLLSCYVGLEAILAADGKQSALLICTDHEEVGSASHCGADGPMLEHFLSRLMPDTENYARMIDRSIMVSADNAHGIHPNYADKHDNLHGPILNQGPVIKINANQRYASNSETQAFFRQLCQRSNVPVQSFVVRTDMACGSTIGPITASGLGVKTVDVGAPTWAMHSIRETAGTMDVWYLYQVLRSLFK